MISNFCHSAVHVDFKSPKEDICTHEKWVEILGPATFGTTQNLGKTTFLPVLTLLLVQRRSRVEVTPRFLCNSAMRAQPFTLRRMCSKKARRRGEKSRCDGQ